MADRSLSTGTPRAPLATPSSAAQDSSSRADGGRAGYAGDLSPAYSEGWSGSPGGEFVEDKDHQSHHDDEYDDADSYGGRSPSRGRLSYRQTSSDDAAKNFKVVIRVRPPLPRELHGDRPFQNTVKVDSSETTITVSENLAALDENGGAAGPYSSHGFTFDHVYDQNCDQKKVYETTAKAVVESSLKGYNATIFAYGQTGTGKTYTMEGFNSAEERGIIPRAIEQVFKHIQSSVSPRMRFLVRASYLQIYNEVISDLLKPERSNLAIREDKKKGVFVEGLSEWVVRSPAEIYGLMERGGAMRATGSTRMNEISSRSHAVFMIITEQSETTYLDDGGNEMSVEEFHRLVKSRAHGESGLKALEANVRQSFKVGKLNLVDLAGSERVRLTGATGQRLEESKKINQSLSALGNVIAALTDPRGRQHIPYRDSKLTRILEDSLGGNCKTTMMAMVSPALEAFVESLSTLKFANRAKNIKNEARVNEDLDQKSLLRRYERELKRLRAELEERSRSVVDGRKLLQLEEERRRAEEDKMAAIRALEARSREFMREKAEKKRLEERITLLQGQVLQGGADKPGGGDAAAAGPVQDTPAFRNALKEHQERMRAEYEGRLAELEKERETIEEEKAQVDRYKQLLLKQRDIMILLTQRLNERDEQIVALQDELDAYDRHQLELEEHLDEKTAALIHLQRVTMEHNAASPVKNSELVEALGDWAGMQRNGGTGAAAVPHEHALSRRLGAAGRRHGSLASVESDSGPVPAQQLLSTRQFPPHELSEEAGGGGASAGGRALSSSPPLAGQAGLPGSSPSLPPLLSAEEKIGELGRLVEGLRGDRDRMSRELEDTQAEKVSMEYLLREKLEKLVQSEIEARLAAYKKDGSPSRAGPAAQQHGLDVVAAAGVGAGADAAARRLQAQVLKLGEESAAARTEAQRSEEEVLRLRRQLQQQSPDAVQQQLAAVKERLSVHEKERKAIHTIMENKIKSLVDAIAAAAASAPTPPPAGQQGGGAPPASPPNPKLLREVQALQRLVNASIAALKNSEADSHAPSAAEAAVGGGGTMPSSSLAAPTPRHHAPVGLFPGAPPAAGASTSSFRDGHGAGSVPISVDAMIESRKAELAQMRGRASGGSGAGGTPAR